MVRAGKQPISFHIGVVMIYNENCSTGLHIRFLSFLFIYLFIYLFWESLVKALENKVRCFSEFRVEIPELRHGRYSDLYFTNSGYVFFFYVFLPKDILTSINIVYALSLSDVSIIKSLLLPLRRWQWFPSKLEHFLIQSTFWQPPLLRLLVTSAMNR